MLLKPILNLLVLFLFCGSSMVKAQFDSTQKEYNSIDEALKNPNEVYRLNLSNQKIDFSSDVWSKFTRLEYLSLKNDRLSKIPEEIGFLKSLKILDLGGNNLVSLPQSFKNLTNLEYLSLKDDKLDEIPEEISFLTNLKTLDLSGNNFRYLPISFSNLTNLEEIFLNDEKKFVLDKSIPVLKSIPNLKTLHLENDSLRELPKGFGKISQLESLYLNNNFFIDVPREIKKMKNLKLVDLHENNLKILRRDVQELGFGFHVVF